jgi:hypothetical protein
MYLENENYIKEIPCANSIDGKELIIHQGNFNFDKKQFIEMQIRLSDFESEGRALFFGVQNELDFKTGDYLPFDFDEPEQIKTIIEFLMNAYAKLFLKNVQNFKLKS